MKKNDLDFEKIEVSKEVLKDIELYISENFIWVDEGISPNGEESDSYIGKNRCACESLENISNVSDNFDAIFDHMDKSFADVLFNFIDKKGITDAECYKKANVSRKTFSKIKCNPSYKPSKETILAFAIALELNINETNYLLKTVGYTLSNSSKFDVIIKYFLEKKIYDITEINNVLYIYNQILLI